MQTVTQTKKMEVDDVLEDGGHTSFNFKAVYQPPPSITAATHASTATYKKMLQDSYANNDQFWEQQATQNVSWFHKFDQTKTGSFNGGDLAWFLNGKLNVSYNCVDRHVAAGKGNKVALIHEGNEPSDMTHVTYAQLQAEVSRLANVLKRNGVRKGDTVAIYMHMTPYIVYAMLACARIGAVHSVVFAGFSADALAQRIEDAKCKVLITASSMMRGPKTLDLKHIVDEALSHSPSIQKVLVLATKNATTTMVPNRDEDLLLAMAQERPYCPCEWVDSEDPLFILYTSGSTGKPKGLLHTTGGYLVYAATTHKYIFDHHADTDIYASVADCGWITGHSYIVYGPLANGATTFLFESLPTYPDPSRYWQSVEKHKITIFYTAPTAIRTLMRFGSALVDKHDLSSLRILGSVGEPINPAAWEWYYNVVGKQKAVVVDTYWQTETGGIVIAPLPGATATKAGSCTLPFFGIEPSLLDSHTGKVVAHQPGQVTRGVLCLSRPWPGMARTIFGDHQRFLDTYLRPYPNHYFTGDGAFRDGDGYFWIIGRVDDVMNVSGHRLGTAEIEGALVSHSAACSEAAVVPIPHDVKGQTIVAFCTLKEGYEQTPDLVSDLKNAVRHGISAIAVPEYLFVVPALPKTRSGKIMRRILRKISEGHYDQLGDTSTLADPPVVEQIVKIVKSSK